MSCAAGIVRADEELVEEQDVHASGRPPGRRGTAFYHPGCCRATKGRSRPAYGRLRPIFAPAESGGLHHVRLGEILFDDHPGFMRLTRDLRDGEIAHLALRLLALDAPFAA